MARKGGTVDMTGIASTVANLSKFKRAARHEAERRIETEKQDLIQEFSTHKVTQEIDGGATADNTSGTLG